MSEFFPHVAIILYRIWPNRHKFLSRVFLLSCITTATGTICETIVTMWLFGSLWNRWQLAFKVATPLLHIAFSAAQLHGSMVFWKMYRKYRRLLLEEEAGAGSFKEENIGIALHVPSESSGPINSRNVAVLDSRP